MTKKRKKYYTRPKICREFGITDRTLRHLERYGLIEFSWETHHGMLRTPLDVAQEQVLQCARIDIHSIVSRHPSFRVLPFERFILLRFFQVESDELHDELVDRNLVHPKHITAADIEEHYGIFFESIPEELKPCALAKRPPNKKETPLFELLLQVAGVLQVYQQPFVEQSFEMLSDDGIKMVIEAATATISPISDICEFLTDTTGVAFNAQAVVFYQWVFSDFSRMNIEDMKYYFKNIPPSHRRLISAALNRTIGDLRIALGLTSDISHDDAYEIAKRESTKRLVQAMESDTLDGDKRFHEALRNFMGFVDREDKKRLAAGNSQKLPDIFNSFQVVPAKLGADIFKLPSPQDNDEESVAQ